MNMDQHFSCRRQTRQKMSVETRSQKRKREGGVLLNSVLDPPASYSPATSLDEEYGGEEQEVEKSESEEEAPEGKEEKCTKKLQEAKVVEKSNMTKVLKRRKVVAKKIQGTKKVKKLNTAGGYGGMLPPEDIKKLKFLCALDTGLFLMPALRNLLRRLIEEGTIKTISSSDLEKKSKRTLCVELRKETKLKLPIPSEAPYKEIENVDKIPVWAWDPVGQGLMYNPYTVSSGRAYFSSSITAQIGEKKDPIVRVPIKGKPHEDWNLREAIKDWIFRETGYELIELQKAKYLDLMNSAEKMYAKKEYGQAMGEYREAFDLCAQLVSTFEASHIGHVYQYAKCLSMGKRYSEAVVEYSKVLKFRPWKTWAMYKRAYSLHHLRKHEDALEDLDKAIAINSKSYLFFFLRAGVLNALNKHSEALESYASALKLNPKHVGSLAARGWLNNKLLRDEEALNDFNEALLLKPAAGELRDIICGRAWAFYGLKRYTEMLTLFEELLSSGPDAPTNRYYLNGCGFALYGLGQYEKALYFFDRSLQKNSESVVINYAVGMILMQLGNYVEAMKIINTCIEENPETTTFLEGRARILEKIGKPKEALNDFLSISQDTEDINECRKLDYFFNLEYVQSRIKCLAEETLEPQK